MEGLPITQWCDERNLDLPERLRLFQKLCDAVHFAHQHLVVHRDLKPPNVLVTPDGEPRLLDFGIAKLMEPVGDSSRTADCALTLVYASPEQVRGDAFSTACDIYSLGVLLYGVVAGKRPYSFSGRPLEEAVDCICQREPAPPSSVASQPLAEDLDAIVLKALRKEPQERYASVRALNDDIEERYLRSLSRACAACGTVRYVATKFPCGPTAARWRSRRLFWRCFAAQRFPSPGRRGLPGRSATGRNNASTRCADSPAR